MGMSFSDILSILAILATLVFGIAVWTHRTKKDNKEDATCIAVIKTDIGYIRQNTAEIKAQQQILTDMIAKNRERITIVEQSTKSAHKRLDGIEKVVGKCSRGNEEDEK